MLPEGCWLILRAHRQRIAQSMNKHLVHAALWALTAGWSAASAAQIAPAGTAGAPDRQDIEGLSRMLRSRVDLAWLFQPELGKSAVDNPEADAEARSIIALAAVARARHLDGQADTRTALHLLETAVLAEAARRDVAKGIAVSDADIRARLAAQPGRYDEFRLSHIFVAVGGEGNGEVTRTDDEAKRKASDLRRRIAAGEDFAQVAARESDDASTAGAGGELSSMFGRYMADEFFPSARALKPGEVSPPVRGKLGYHLLRLEQRIPATVETARFQVTQDIRDERMPALIAQAIRETKP